MSFEKRIGELPSKLNVSDPILYWKENFSKISLKTKTLIEENQEDKDREQLIVSSSIIAAILGQDIYSSEEEIFKLKTGQIKPKEQTEAMTNGIYKEAHVAQLFTDKNGIELFKLPVVVSKFNKYIGVSIDRITTDGFIVEIKAPFSAIVHEDEDLEYVKESQLHYWHQIQLQLHTLDIEYAWFVRWGGPPNKNHDKTKNKNAKEILSIVQVPRDHLWWDTNKDKILNFIDKVLDFRKQNKK